MLKTAHVIVDGRLIAFHYFIEKVSFYWKLNFEKNGQENYVVAS